MKLMELLKAMKKTFSLGEELFCMQSFPQKTELFFTTLPCLHELHVARSAIFCVT
jgi:hypothetical protein